MSFVFMVFATYFVSMLALITFPYAFLYSQRSKWDIDQGGWVIIGRSLLAILFIIASVATVITI